MNCAACNTESDSLVPFVCPSCSAEGWRLPSSELMKAASLSFNEDGSLSISSDEADE